MHVSRGELPRNPLASLRFEGSAADFRAQGLSVVPAPSGLWTQQEFRIRRWVPSIEALSRSQVALYEDLGNLVLALHAARATGG